MDDEIPTGLEYVAQMAGFASTSGANSNPSDKDQSRLKATGNALSALYQIATCHSVCNKGNHALQSLSGRAHNHGCGALLLLDTGFYDESLNLTRSVAEIVNLLTLFVADPHEYGRWVESTRRNRIKKYGPWAVREKLKKLAAPLPISAEWYRDLCESVTHPVPGVSPNARMRNGERVGFVGGMYDQVGHDNCSFQLFYVCINCALALASATQRTDLTDLLEVSVKTHLEVLQQVAAERS